MVRHLELSEENKYYQVHSILKKNRGTIAMPIAIETKEFGRVEIYFKKGKAVIELKCPKCKQRGRLIKSRRNIYVIHGDVACYISRKNPYYRQLLAVRMLS
jgi:phage FluMu protein Com